MKKYRLKFDCPTGNKGQEISEDYKFFTTINTTKTPKDFPDIFEEVIEDPILVVANFLGWKYPSPLGVKKVNALIAAGLDVNKLEVSNGK